MDITHCHLCPNACGADRRRSPGRCHAPAEALVCRAALQYGEEPVLSGSRGSGCIFFAGCSMDCVFCQNYEISHFTVGKACSATQIVDTIRDLERKGAHNIHFVNPTHYAHILYEALHLYRPAVPVVYNTGGYDSVQTLRELEGLIDVYLPDLKYLSPQSAAKYSGRPDYPAVACAAIAEMYRQTGPVLVQDGLLHRGLLIRHLVMPGLSSESVRIIEYLAGQYGDRIFLSVMSQYTPHGKAADFPEINRALLPIEYKRAVAALRRTGMQHVFVQDPDSTGEEYIPAFQT